MGNRTVGVGSTLKGTGAGGAMEQVDGSPPAFDTGALVRLTQTQPYLKTADPMPMLRPPDLAEAGDEGVVVELCPRNMLAVRFRRGTFLLAADQVEPVV